MKNALRKIRLSVPPSDRLLLAVLALAVGVAIWKWSEVGGALTPFVIQLSLMFFAFLICVFCMAKWEHSKYVPILRPLITIAVVFTCYSSLGRLGLIAMTYRADSTLSACDIFLLGFDPTIAIQPYQTYGRVVFFSIIYGAFIPYIYLSLFLGCLGRRPIERDQFLTGWVLTYVFSYLGYLFAPAQGPVVFQADQYTTALEGGFFLDLVVKGIDSVGGPKGAFPSLHVGASVYLCLFDLTTNRLRGLTYLPIVVLIYFATVFLRYHYVIDLIAGTAIAIVCVPLGRRLFSSWVQDRKKAKMPALPGGESDNLSILSSDSSAND